MIVRDMTVKNDKALQEKLKGAKDANAAAAIARGFGFDLPLAALVNNLKLYQLIHHGWLLPNEFIVHEDQVPLAYEKVYQRYHGEMGDDGVRRPDKQDLYDAYISGLAERCEGEGP